MQTLTKTRRPQVRQQGVSLAVTAPITATEENRLTGHSCKISPAVVCQTTAITETMATRIVAMPPTSQQARATNEATIMGQKAHADGSQATRLLESQVCHGDKGSATEGFVRAGQAVQAKTPGDRHRAPISRLQGAVPQGRIAREAHSTGRRLTTTTTYLEVTYPPPCSQGCTSS